MCLWHCQFISLSYISRIQLFQSVRHGFYITKNGCSANTVAPISSYITYPTK